MRHRALPRRRSFTLHLRLRLQLFMRRCPLPRRRSFTHCLLPQFRLFMCRPLPPRPSFTLHLRLQLRLFMRRRPLPRRRSFTLRLRPQLRLFMRRRPSPGAGRSRSASGRSSGCSCAAASSPSAGRSRTASACGCSCAAIGRCTWTSLRRARSATLPEIDAWALSSPLEQRRFARMRAVSCFQAKGLPLGGRHFTAASSTMNGDSVAIGICTSNWPPGRPPIGLRDEIIESRDTRANLLEKRTQQSVQCDLAGQGEDARPEP